MQEYDPKDFYFQLVLEDRFLFVHCYVFAAWFQTRPRHMSRSPLTLQLWRVNEALYNRITIREHVGGIVELEYKQYLPIRVSIKKKKFPISIVRTISCIVQSPAKLSRFSQTNHSRQTEHHSTSTNYVNYHDHSHFPSWISRPHSAWHHYYLIVRFGEERASICFHGAIKIADFHRSGKSLRWFRNQPLLLLFFLQ